MQVLNWLNPPHVWRVALNTHGYSPHQQLTARLCCLVPPVCCCRHGDELPLEIERLWRTLAHNRRNIIPMLDFLASLGTHMAYQVGGWLAGRVAGRVCGWVGEVGWGGSDTVLLGRACLWA